MVGKTEKKTHNTNYFRYESLEEIERKVEVGEVISGFTLESTGDDTWVAFGDNGKKVNIVRINKLTKTPKRRECGFMYMRCEIGPQVDNPNMTVDGLEMVMVQYWLFCHLSTTKRIVLEGSLQLSMMTGRCVMTWGTEKPPIYAKHYFKTIFSMRLLSTLPF